MRSSSTREEGEATAWESMAETMLARLRAGLERQRSASTQSGGYPFKALETDYHGAIAQASRNEFLIKFIHEDYKALVEICRRRHVAASREHLLKHLTSTVPSQEKQR